MSTPYENGYEAGKQSVIFGTFHDNPFADCACTDCQSDASDWHAGFSDGQEFAFNGHPYSPRSSD